MGANEHHSSQVTAAVAPGQDSSAAEPGRGDGTAEAVRLIDRAAQLRLRAPEMTYVLSRRAAELAEAAGANALWVQAEGLVVLANIRLGHRAGTVGRAVAALRAAEDAGDDVLAVRLRSGLAVCARSVGLPLTGFTLLWPALSASGVPGAHRAVALSQLVGCVTGVASKAELDKVLAEADRLCRADGTLDADDKLVVRALLRATMSAHRRRHGDLVGAADAARTGIGFVDGLEDGRADGGVARIRLVLELVTSLLDRGETAVALDAAAPVLAEPLRAAEVAPAAWLRLAIATRVHLPSGAGLAATQLLRDAVRDTDRHSMSALSARIRSELAHVEERMQRPVEALRSLRQARADERAHARLRGRAYAVLTSEFGAGERPRVDFAEILAEPKQAVASAEEPAEKAQAAHVPESPVAEQVASSEDEETAFTAGSGVGETAHGTRHAERTSRDAGSVLNRLGISGGSSVSRGGRRRALEAGSAAGPGGTHGGTEHTGADAGTGADASAEPTTGARSDSGAAGDVPERASEPEQDDWLPRLRLPPSLAPIEELVSGAVHDQGAAEQAVTGSDAAAEEAGQREAVTDEPPADAGLAELLTRALAEHQAGTSSASALVKRLGSGDEPAEGDRRINGRHRDAE